MQKERTISFSLGSSRLIHLMPDEFKKRTHAASKDRRKTIVGFSGTMGIGERIPYPSAIPRRAADRHPRDFTCPSFFGSSPLEAL
jgi:hypothetical protein